MNVDTEGLLFVLKCSPFVILGVLFFSWLYGRNSSRQPGGERSSSFREPNNGMDGQGPDFDWRTGEALAVSRWGYLPPAEMQELNEAHHAAMIDSFHSHTYYTENEWDRVATDYIHERMSS
jgi:hypothetical protein